MHDVSAAAAYKTVAVKRIFFIGAVKRNEATAKLVRPASKKVKRWCKKRKAADAAFPKIG